MAKYYADNTAPALQMDGLIRTHPVSVPITDPSVITSIFDAISYNKVLCTVCCMKTYVSLHYIHI